MTYPDDATFTLLYSKLCHAVATIFAELCRDQMQRSKALQGAVLRQKRATSPCRSCFNKKGGRCSLLLIASDLSIQASVLRGVC